LVGPALFGPNRNLGMDDSLQVRRSDNPAVASTASFAPAYLTYEELSARTGISVSTLRRRVKDGKLPYFQPGGRRTRLVFPVDVVERLLQSAPTSSQTLPESQLQPVAHPLQGPQPKWMRNGSSD
jgi:excisionase family DNA binding protein